MQIVNVYDDNIETASTKLKDALTQYGSGYFDSYDTDFTDESGLKVVNCYIGNDVVVKFKQKTNSPFSIEVGSITLGAHTSNSMYITRVYACDKGIVFFTSTGNNAEFDYPIMMCKTEHGNIAFVNFTGSISSHEQSSPRIYTYGTGYPSFLSTICLNKTTKIAHNKTTTVLPADSGQTAGANDPTSIQGYQLFDPVDGAMLDGVYFIQYCGIRDNPPGYFVANGTTYTGFGKYTLALKGQ